MKRLLVLLLSVLPTYAFATTWQIDAVGHCPEHGSCVEGATVTGHFEENEGTLGAWRFAVTLPMWGEGAGSDDLHHRDECSPFEPCDVCFGSIPCERTATLLSPGVQFHYANGGPDGSGSLLLPLVANFGSAKVIDLVPGNCHFNEAFQECEYSGALYYSGGGGSPYTILLSGTITAVPEPSIAVFLLLVLLVVGWQGAYRRITEEGMHNGVHT